VGTAVKLKLARKDSQEFIEKSVVRDVIKIPTTKATLRQDGIFDIEVYNFGATAASEFRQALRQFMQSGSKKLIIDLRGNPGGYLEAAVDMASWFLPMGSVVVQEDFGGKQEPTVHRSKGYNVYRSDWKVVKLGAACACDVANVTLIILIKRGITSKTIPDCCHRLFACFILLLPVFTFMASS
jgi:carboxyl-terminal processing protease